MDTQTAFGFSPCDNVDGSGEGLTAIDAASSSFDDFYPLNVIDVDGEVNGQMSRVRIADIDTVEQDGELVFRTSVHADVGLNAEASTLPDVNSCSEFQQVVDRLGTGGFDVLSVNHLYEANGFVGRERRTGGSHFHFAEQQSVFSVRSRHFLLLFIVVFHTHGHDGC